MDIFLPPEILSSKAGCGFFCNRLKEAFIKLGVNIVTDNSESDFAIHVIHIGKANTKFNILRLDGIYYDTSIDYKARNSVILKSYLKADAVIYQSEFSKASCEKYLGKFGGPNRIIFNGAVCDKLHNKPYDKSHRYTFLCSARWRPVKRLAEIIKAFLYANIDDSILYVAGDISKSGISKKYNKIPNIKFLGVIDQHQLSKYLMACDVFMHLAYNDPCPNSVVEAIASHKAVICGNAGGTPELVSPSGGIICDIDAPFDFKPLDLSNPPKIDVQIVADAIRRLYNNYPASIFSEHININNIANQYIEFLESL
jgi:glycosyltransferase involved in cell wall biosynthesis